MKPENLLPCDGEVFHFESFLKTSDSHQLFDRLKNSMKWKQYPITIFGKTHMQPRLISWHADSGIEYSYSNQKLLTQPWTPELFEIKEKLQEFLGEDFNSVLINYYRNENDGNGWHSDDEKELGINPAIASLSLGETRDFKMQHKYKKKLKLSLTLENASLLLMKGKSQSHWKHSIPKRSRPLGPRINLTFRKII